MACAPKVLPAGMATRLIRIHCSNHKHLDESIGCAPCVRSKCRQQSLSKPHFSRNEGNIVVVRLQEGEGITLPSQRCHKGHTTHVGRTEAVPRHWLSLANYDPCCGYAAPWRQTVRHGLSSRGLVHLNAQALQPLFDLSHTSTQNAV